MVLVLGGSPATAVKHGQPDATVPNLPDGLWWAVTTVGYGDTYPKTAVGHGVGVALMLLGISLFSVVAANVTAFFVEEREDERPADVRALRRALQILRQPE